MSKATMRTRRRRYIAGQQNVPGGLPRWWRESHDRSELARIYDVSRSNETLDVTNKLLRPSDCPGSLRDCADEIPSTARL
jgi:hypothetical protein